MRDVKSADERRFLILKGIGEGPSCLEIASGMGVDRILVMRDLRSMHYNRDPALKQAHLDRSNLVVANGLIHCDRS